MQKKNFKKKISEQNFKKKISKKNFQKKNSKKRFQKKNSKKQIHKKKFSPKHFHSKNHRPLKEVIIFRDRQTDRQTLHHYIYIIINIGALFWSLLVICKEDDPNDNQNKRDRAARIVANDHLDDPASYVPLILVIVGHLQRGQSQRRLFGPKKAKYGRLISVPRWSKGSKMAQNGEPNCHSL